jgi:hypothetical protein
MPLFDFFGKKPAGPQATEFKRAPNELKAAVVEVRRAQQMGGDWDVVDDSRVEAEAKLLAAEATRKAHAEAARQEGDRLRLLNAMKAAQQQERDRLARQERVERLVVTAASSLRARAVMSSTRWDAFLVEHRQAHDRLDKIIDEACCWRCGQSGRLPVEDAVLFRRPVPPARLGGHADDMVIAGSRRLVSARKEALETWRSYNDRRLDTEKLRLDANYHPALADRFEIHRRCEVCDSLGMFHAAHFCGNHWQTGVSSLDSRWAAQMAGFSVWVPGFVFGGDWVPVAKLTRDQAKAWLRAPERREPVHKSSLEYRAARKEWDELVAAGRLKPTNTDSPHWLGRKFETHYYTKDGKEIYISMPPAPSRERTCRWPDDANWAANSSYPDRWKGGAVNDLYIKPGVIYGPEMQDPLSKEQRLPPARPPIDDTPTEAKLQFRTMFWLGAL